MFVACVHALLLAYVADSTRETISNANAPEYDAYSLTDVFSFKHPEYPGSVINGRMKIVFPADHTKKELSPDRHRSPFPLVIFLGGALLERNRYQWIGEKLAADYGVAWVGVDVMIPIPIGHMLVSMAGGMHDPHEPNPGFVALFKKLRDINAHTKLLKGCLNVDNVILGGHSWGGRVVLVDGANKGFFPNVKGAFVYAAHAERIPGPGYVPGTMLPLEGSVPLMVMAGTKDRAIGKGLPSSFESGLAAIRYMFEKAISPKRRSYYVELDGFNHMSIVYPEDRTIRTAKFDGKATHDKSAMMKELYKIISLFVQSYGLGEAKDTEKLVSHLKNETNPYIKDARIKG